MPKKWFLGIDSVQNVCHKCPYKVYTKVLNEGNIIQPLICVVCDHKTQGFSAQKSLGETSTSFTRYLIFAGQKAAKMAKIKVPSGFY